MLRTRSAESYLARHKTLCTLLEVRYIGHNVILYKKSYL